MNSLNTNPYHQFFAEAQQWASANPLEFYFAMVVTLGIVTFKLSRS